MGVHVSFSGSALGQHDRRLLLRCVLEAGGSVSRIDLAVDVHDWWFVDWFEDELRKGNAVTRSRKYQVIRSESGWTIYVGSRTSEKFLRIYDKRAESNLDYDLTRVELECKGSYADGVARYVDSEGYKDFPAVIKGYCDFPTIHPWVQAMATVDVWEGIPKETRETNTIGWLMNTVAPSVARLLLEDHEKFVSFLRKVYTIAGVGEAAGGVDPFDGAADFDPTPYLSRKSREAYKD